MSVPKGALPVEDLKPTRARHLTKGPFYVAKILVNLFSGTGRREPPSKNKILHGRLITIVLSHYCEKARWGLDLLEADSESPFYYTEDAHAPPFLAFATVAASGDTASASPMLVFDNKKQDGDVNMLCKSDVILREMCPFLYPKEIEHDIIKLEADIGRRLGAGGRCFGYHNLLNPDFYPVLKGICCNNTSKIEMFLFDKMLDKGVAKGMRKLIGINEDSSKSGLQAVREVFHEVSCRLEETGGEYLMDTETESYGFTALDLTFAALAYIIVLPPEMSEFQCPESDLPPEIISLIHEVRPTLAAKHAMKMYHMHRFGVRNQPISNTAGARVIPKSVGRDRLPWMEAALVVGSGVALVALIQSAARLVLS